MTDPSRSAAISFLVGVVLFVTGLAIDNDRAGIVVGVTGGLLVAAGVLAWIGSGIYDNIQAQQTKALWDAESDEGEDA